MLLYVGLLHKRYEWIGVILTKINRFWQASKYLVPGKLRCSHDDESFRSVLIGSYF